MVSSVRRRTGSELLCVQKSATIGWDVCTPRPESTSMWSSRKRTYAFGCASLRAAKRRVWFE
jgi:hypothetical protein